MQSSFLQRKRQIQITSPCCQSWCNGRSNTERERKNGERRSRVKVCLVEWIVTEHREGPGCCSGRLRGESADQEWNAYAGKDCTGRLLFTARPCRLKVRSHLRPKHRFPSYDPEDYTSNTRKPSINGSKKCPGETRQTICRETEMVRGCEAQDRGGARVFCSSFDIVALVLWSLGSEHCLISPGFLEDLWSYRRRRCEQQFTKTVSRFLTAFIFPESHAKLITINHQTKLLSIFRRPTELGYKKYGPQKSHQKNVYGLTQEREQSSKVHSH